MTSTTAPAPVRRRSTPVPVRVGLVLGGLLSALQISTGVGLWRAEGLGVDVAILVLVAVVALVAIVLAWRGSFPARVVTVVAVLVPALMGLPAYFIDDIPPGAVLAVSVGILLALVVAVLLLRPGRRSAR
jgi:hypothetical protein